MKLSQVSTMPKRDVDKVNRVSPTENQILVFSKLVRILYPYARLMRAESRISSKQIYSTPSQFELWTHHHREMETRSKSPGVLFAGASIRKECVGLYFFPLVVNPSLKDKIPGTHLPQLLHGASAFHITELTNQLIEEIFELLNMGIQYYQEIGWI